MQMDDPTDFMVDITSINVSVQNEKSEIVNLNKCPTFKKILEEMKEPFIVSYVNGLIRDIRVQKNNENLSVNLKLLLGMTLQMNETSMLDARSQFTYHSKEDTLYGSCGVNTDFSRTISSDQSVRFNLKKNYDMNSCSNINKPIDPASSLINICNPISKKNLHNELKEDWVVGVKSNVSTFYMILKQSDCYNPWKDSSAKMCSQTDANFDFKSLKSDYTPSNLIQDKLDAVTALRYTEVDDSLVDISSSNPLRKAYSALACDPYNSNYVMELYWHAIKCSSA